jgi:hypothetical protein
MLMTQIDMCMLLGVRVGRDVSCKSDMYLFESKEQL